MKYAEKRFSQTDLRFNKDAIYMDFKGYSLKIPNGKVIEISSTDTDIKISNIR